jgi:hypothetical protein
VVREVLQFVGAQPELLRWRAQEARMASDYQGRVMHPSMRRRLAQRFAASSRRLCGMLGRGFSWAGAQADVEAGGGSQEGGGGAVQ